MMGALGDHVGNWERRIARDNPPFSSHLAGGAAMKRPPLRRLFSRVAIFGVLGAAVSFGIAIALAAWVDPRQGPSATSSAFDGEAKWSATAWARPGAVFIQSDRDSSWAW